ncbi:MAG: hypothetical protein WC955_03120 [Elusimicrobiota bacterium]
MINKYKMSILTIFCFVLIASNLFLIYKWRQSIRWIPYSANKNIVLKVGEHGYLDLPKSVKTNKLNSFITDSKTIQVEKDKITATNPGHSTIVFTNTEPVYVFSIDVEANDLSNRDISIQKYKDEQEILSQIQELIENVFIAIKSKDRNTALKYLISEREFNMLPYKKVFLSCGFKNYGECLLKYEEHYNILCNKMLNWSFENVNLERQIKQSITADNDDYYLIIRDIYATFSVNDTISKMDTLIDIKAIIGIKTNGKYNWKILRLS